MSNSFADRVVGHFHPVTGFTGTSEQGQCFNNTLPEPVYLGSITLNLTVPNILGVRPPTTAFGVYVYNAQITDGYGGPYCIPSLPSVQSHPTVLATSDAFNTTHVGPKGMLVVFNFTGHNSIKLEPKRVYAFGFHSFSTAGKLDDHHLVSLATTTPRSSYLWGDFFYNCVDTCGYSVRFSHAESITFTAIGCLHHPCHHTEDESRHVYKSDDCENRSISCSTDLSSNQRED